MKKFLALLALATFSMTAAAHGPSPHILKKTVTIKAPPAKVWAMLKDFGNIQLWLPPVESTKLEKKGNDTFRVLTLKDGGTITEQLKGIDEDLQKIKYGIVDGVAPVSNYNAYMKVSPGANANESEVKWQATFYRKYTLNPPIPAGQDDESADKFVNDVFDAGLANLKKVLENSK